MPTKKRKNTSKKKRKNIPKKKLSLAPKKSKPVATKLVAKTAVKAEGLNGNLPEATPPLQMFHYKNREVESMRPATVMDSGYLEGEDQVVVTFKDTHAQATAWRKDIEAVSQ